jgi:hypothetical protein
MLVELVMDYASIGFDLVNFSGSCYLYHSSRPVQNRIKEHGFAKFCFLTFSLFWGLCVYLLI